MREVVVNELCDPCWLDGEVRVPSFTTVTVDLDGRGPKEVEVCEDHHKVLFVPLYELLEAAGREPDPEEVAARTTQPFKRDREPCKFCGKPYSVGMGMTRHVNSKHADVAA